MIPFSCFSLKPLLLTSCVCGLLLSACTAGNQMIDPFKAREKRETALQDGATRQPASGVSQRDLLMPAFTSINKRIYSYEQKLEEWKEVEKKTSSLPLPADKQDKINECQAQLQDILTEYNGLHKQLLQETQLSAAQLLAGDSLLRLNQRDIEYLESGCGRLLAELKATPEPQAQPTVDPQIREAFDNADYDRVITLYGQAAGMPGQTPAAESTYQYGQSLLKNHQEPLARRVFGDLLARVRQQPGQDELLFPLMQVLADLDFVMGAYEDARKQYEELIRVSIDKGARKEEWAGLQLAALQSGSTTTDEFNQYSTLLKNHLAYSPKRDGYAVAEQAEKYSLTFPVSRLAPNVNIIHASAKGQAEAWVSQGIKRIEAQANERRIQEPQPVVGAVPSAQLLSEGQGAVTSGGQAASPESVAAPEKALQEYYDKGVSQLQAKEYDHAIESWNKLLNTSYADKARPRIEEAARLGAQEDRQKAADLFVRATNTRDPESRRKLLLSSQELLQGILIKYPQSGLNDKVQRNLSRIQEELNVIAPASAGGAYVPPGS
jgi:tetratricopeptide (TPR) repeat protein